MKERTLHNTPLIKPGIGQHIYLMFAGKRQPSDLSELPAKPQGLPKIIGAVLLLGAACLIGIVLWRQISTMY